MQELNPEAGSSGSEDKRVRLNLWVSRSTYDFLEVVSARDGRSMSDIVREALRDHQAKDRKLMAVEVGDSSGRGNS